MKKLFEFCGYHMCAATAAAPAQNFVQNNSDIVIKTARGYAGDENPPLLSVRYANGKGGRMFGVVY